jgi:hypothetical protein
MDEFRDSEGPVEEYSRGRFVIYGQAHSNQGEGVGKDIRLVGSTVSEWKERKGHTLSPAMITGIFDSDVEILVIGTGIDGLVEVPEETRKYVIGRGISRLILLRTPAACRTYNELYREGQAVALLAHGTC